MKKKIGLAALPVRVFRVMLTLGIIWMFSASALAMSTPPGALLVGDETCLSCHDQIGEEFAKTLHGTIAELQSSNRAITCESCHGPGSVHADESDPEKIINPAKGDQFGSVTCLGCHSGEKFDDWTFAQHNTADVNCSSCHTIHAEHRPRSADNIQEKCYGCHSDVRAASFMPSHHPVREGKMTCLDCHNPHGGQATLTMENTGRELCFSCHPEKEGPFVYEHAPVNEDCMVCHTPHGSVADNLLIQTEPALCLNCHAMHFHATIEGWDGNFTVPLAPERAGYSTPDGWKKGMLTKCTQCHTEIHGSDLPSQAISTSGNALTR
nr:DmsE family decaheme c-type cytochrome [candidate division Zixibacteria bacterium]